MTKVIRVALSIFLVFTVALFTNPLTANAQVACQNAEQVLLTPNSSCSFEAVSSEVLISSYTVGTPGNTNVKIEASSGPECTPAFPLKFSNTYTKENQLCKVKTKNKYTITNEQGSINNVIIRRENL